MIEITPNRKRSYNYRKSELETSLEDADSILHIYL